MYNLKRLREHLGLKQQDVANILNCTQANIALIEKNFKDLTEEQLTILSNQYGEETVISFYLDESELPNANSRKVNNSISKEIDILIGEQQKSISELIDLVKKLQAENSKLTDALIRQKII